MATKKKATKKKASTGRGLSTIITSLGAILAFLASAVKLLTYFFDPAERERKRKQAAIKQNKIDSEKVNSAIDGKNEDKLNDILNTIEERRKKSKKSLKRKVTKKCKKVRYSRYCS